MSGIAYRKPDLEPQGDQIRGKKGKKAKAKDSAHSSANTAAIPSGNDPFSGIFAPTMPHGNPANTANHSTLALNNADPVVEQAKGKQKKKEFINMLQVHEGSLEIILPGRHPCQCLCTKHDLINNCLSCGRIVCVQEGSGPCFTCGQIVGTDEEIAVLMRGGLDAEKLQRKMFGSEQLTLDFEKMIKLDANKSDTLMKAEAQRDKLLEYDRTAAQRTRIIDDQADYYSEHAFMTKEEREAIRKKEAELRSQRFRSVLERKHNMSLDFAGRQVSFQKEDRGPDNMYADPVDAEPLRIPETVPNFSLSRDPDQWQKLFTSSVDRMPAHALIRTERTSACRVQDRELLEMCDNGMALSVRQPWASFITMGLKLHEGRDWYTAHRGKLWIASGSKLPPPNEIIEEENLVKAVTGNAFIVFPEQYLTGFLLGSVDVVDCITQEEYQKRFPGGLLMHPYILLLENPLELTQKFPIEGKSKIFKMDIKLHQFAKA
ncbi:activating signal cointegrator 1-like isoform X1 [Paramacrobiotus metropolitanus]|uniref:activating signal cointegrator 1-like isoform X1 n=1 Tax=Paramacrobiotus metropolitanus TaxID=2943436 RepID=UPI002445884F|nr:activating signal cointegrator 1-like isoform X1 [Paramacrobiotus metropolitanus]